MSARVILLTGPSGSGKTSLLRRVGAPRLNLDDFYRDGDEPEMPLLAGGTTGQQGTNWKDASRTIDWDHPASWDAKRAMAAILELCTKGSAQVPVYSLPDNATVGYTSMDIGQAPVFVAEGVFAAELVQGCREAGVLAEALVLRRPRLQTWWHRLRRDLHQRRKPAHVLLARGLRLAHAEPRAIAQWVAKGCRAVGVEECEACIRGHSS